MTGFPRYAIYFAAGIDNALSRFGAELLGYDAYTGDELPFPREALQIAPDWRDVSADPRKYGFHGTLKAPMALASDKTEAELMAACAAFAGRARPLPVIRPVVDAISGFIAVIPAEPVEALQELAADSVRDFDAFRAPLTADDRARRRPEKLSERQRDYLDRWGYPYVMEEFRFHMTLTGRLDAERRGPILQMLRGRFTELKLHALTVDRIALFKQDDAKARFRIIGEWALARMDLSVSSQD
ncbi:putative phosphonate metabolism protein [Bradyrhizobium sp. USDA 377]